MRQCKTIVLILAIFSSLVLANKNEPKWLSEGPYLEDSSTSFEIPVKVSSTKLYLELNLGGSPRRFVVDTGSPSMIDTALVKELGLKVIGTNNGLDAHGAVVETKIVQANIPIGNTIIKKVPMMAANFSASVATKEFVGDGVLGSDLLPLGAWQLDLKNSVIRFNTKLINMPNIRKAKKLTLHQFGYPYMPIFDVKFSKNARSKAMFDTGSPTFFAISQADLSGAQKGSGIVQRLHGYGSPGASLGGQAPNTELIQVELKTLAIDKLKLGRVVAEGRDLVPSLIGAKILQNYIVTLDSRSKTAYFKKYSDNLFTYSSFGFSLAFNNSISIGAVWENSPAQAAGLQPGLQLISINGIAVELTKEGLSRATKAMNEQEIELAWEGGSAKLTRKLLFPMK